MNHYPRHIGDWMRDTAHLSEVEECLYSRMIDTYYSREKPLPVDEAQCCRLVRANSAAARKAVGTILREFFDLQGDGWHQKRCDAELAKYAEKSAKASASVSARWNKRNTDVDTNVLRTNAERNTSQEPVTSNQEPVKARAVRARAPATLLPSDWKVPLDWLLWAERERREWTDADLHRCAGIFADHWRSKGEARSDWEATWRNWVRRERATKVNGTQHDARMDVADQIFKRGKYASGGTAERDITSTAERVD